MSELAENQIELEGEKISLADLAGVSLDDVAEKRFSALPRGVYKFRVSVDPAPALEKLGEKAAAVFPCVVEDVIALKNPAADAPDGVEKLFGRTHRESLFITNTDSLGYIKAFLKDIGGDGLGPLGDQIVGSGNFLFQAPVVHRTDKNDTDKVYVSIDRSKIKALGRVEGSALAGAVS